MKNLYNMVEVACPQGQLNLAEITTKMKNIGLDLVQKIDDPFSVLAGVKYFDNLGITFIHKVDSFYIYLSDKVGYVIEFARGCSFQNMKAAPDYVVHFLNTVGGSAI